jgi:hypothetical protein
MAERAYKKALYFHSHPTIGIMRPLDGRFEPQAAARVFDFDPASERARRQILLNSCQWSRANFDCSSLHQRNNVLLRQWVELALSQRVTDPRCRLRARKWASRVSSPSPLRWNSSAWWLCLSRALVLARSSSSKLQQSALIMNIARAASAPTRRANTQSRRPLCDY